MRTLPFHVVRTSTSIECLTSLSANGRATQVPGMARMLQRPYYFSEVTILKIEKKLMAMLCMGVLAASVFAPEVNALPAPRRIEIEARKFAYSPSEITLKRGEPVLLVLKNKDVAHGLRIRELNINLKAKAGEEAELAFTPDKMGVYIGQCSVFCGEEHGAMTIGIHVVA